LRSKESKKATESPSTIKYSPESLNKPELRAKIITEKARIIIQARFGGKYTCNGREQADAIPSADGILSVQELRKANQG